MAQHAFPRVGLGSQRLGPAGYEATARKSRCIVSFGFSCFKIESPTHKSHTLRKRYAQGVSQPLLWAAPSGSYCYNCDTRTIAKTPATRVSGLIDPPPLPAELRGVIPRTVPIEMYDAPGMHQFQYRCWIAVVTGIIMLLLSLLPIIKTWAMYLLPLAYLMHAGFVVAAVGAIYWLWFKATGGPTRYIERGKAAMAEILDAKIVAEEFNGVVSYTPKINVQFRDERNTVQTHEFTLPGVGEDKLFKRSLNVSAGDWTPVVWYSSNPTGTRKLYYALGLSAPDPKQSAVVGPNAFWRDLDAAPRGKQSRWAVAISAIGLFGFFFMMGWMVWAYSQYITIEDPSWTMIAISIAGGVLIAGVGLFFVVKNQTPEPLVIEGDDAKEAIANVAKMNEQTAIAAAEQQALHAERVANQNAVTRFFSRAMGLVDNVYALVIGLVLLFGAVLLPAAMFGSLLLSANALLDRSEGKQVPARVTEMTMTTHNFIIRHFEIDYMVREGEFARVESSRLSTPHEMRRFHNDDALVTINEGFFGWPWVSKIDPAPMP